MTNLCNKSYKTGVIKFLYLISYIFGILILILLIVKILLLLLLLLLKLIRNKSKFISNARTSSTPSWRLTQIFIESCLTFKFITKFLCIQKKDISLIFYMIFFFFLYLKCHITISLNEVIIKSFCP